MAYLLDTNTFLWLFASDNQLPISVRKTISDINISCFMSIAFFWRIAIKKQIGKLVLAIQFPTPVRFAERDQIERSINESHIKGLEFIKNDPFDRIIVSQAISKDLILISRDQKLKNYKINLKWD